MQAWRAGSSLPSRSASLRSSCERNLKGRSIRSAPFFCTAAVRLRPCARVRLGSALRRQPVEQRSNRAYVVPRPAAACAISSGSVPRSAWAATTASGAGSGAQYRQDRPACRVERVAISRTCASLKRLGDGYGAVVHARCTAVAATSRRRVVFASPRPMLITIEKRAPGLGQSASRSGTCPEPVRHSPKSLIPRGRCRCGGSPLRGCAGDVEAFHGQRKAIAA